MQDYYEQYVTVIAKEIRKFAWRSRGKYFKNMKRNTDWKD